MDSELAKALREDTPRSERAHQFANTIYRLMRDYIPQGRECFDLMWDHLLTEGFRHNLQVISVPPEFDALNKLELERRMVETHPVFIRANASSTSSQPPKERIQEPPQVPEAPRQ